MNTQESTISINRAKAALQLSFIADALAMPVHWFYNPLDIYRAFHGGIKTFEAAPVFHPSSIMNLHSTNAGGRGSQQVNNAPQVVGDVILKGKHHYWGVANQHYHRGMAAGENTLNLHCMRMLMRGMANNSRRYNASIFLRDYIQFMTAETPQHPDTYAESYHRGFFANLVKGIPPERSAAKTHDTASIGGLISIAPVAIAELLVDRSLARVQTLCRTHLFLTHPDNHLGSICNTYVALIDALLFRDVEDARALIASTAKKSAGIDVSLLAQKYQDDNQVVGGKFSRACYIDDAWPGLLYLAWKYSENPQQALIANANLGGDNCHRGAVLGVILGLATGDGLSDWFAQLQHAAEISNELSKFLNYVK